MMKVFGDNSGRFMDMFTKQFESTFMDIVRRRFKTKRVFANLVYNEYIQDRDHAHLSSTRYGSLAAFVKHLGATGQCEVEETEKGWFIKYIERDPLMQAKQEAEKSKEKAKEIKESREMKLLYEQMRAYRDSLGIEDSDVEEDEEDGEEEEVEEAESAEPAPEIKINLNTINLKSTLKNVFEDDPSSEDEKHSKSSKLARGSEVSESTKGESKQKLVKTTEDGPIDTLNDDHKDHWIYPNIVVKIVTKKLKGGAYYGKKVSRNFGTPRRSSHRRARSKAWRASIWLPWSSSRTEP